MTPRDLILTLNAIRITMADSERLDQIHLVEETTGRGAFRRIHGEAATVAVVSRKPLGVTLREVLEKGGDSLFTEAAAKQFGMSTVHAVILADGSDGAQPANFVLPPESWKEGRVYEIQDEEPLRYLRGVQLLRRGDDYVRATFQWLPKPD